MWNILETQQILFEYVRLCGVCVCSVSVVYVGGDGGGWWGCRRKNGSYFAGGARREVINQTLKRTPKNAND